MALIWEPGASDSGRWVKEGAPVGHLVIHEVRDGSVVLRDGEKFHEVSIESQDLSTAVVADAGAVMTRRAHTAASSTRPTTVPDRPQRPMSSGRFTVGSARTSTPDR